MTVRLLVDIDEDHFTVTKLAQRCALLMSTGEMSGPGEVKGVMTVRSNSFDELLKIVSAAIVEATHRPIEVPEVLPFKRKKNGAVANNGGK